MLLHPVCMHIAIGVGVLLLNNNNIAMPKVTAVTMVIKCKSSNNGNRGYPDND